MTAFYLAASFPTQAGMRAHREQLEGLGHTVTSRWLDERAAEANFNSSFSTHKGIKDLEDIDAADVLLLFTGNPSSTGGFHVEFGYALGKKKTAIVIGPYTNIFQRQCEGHFADWTHFLRSFPL